MVSKPIIISELVSPPMLGLREIFWKRLPVAVRDN
jgi:hypothetical protein